MARENQGLQIALIIFVMLTILLGVMTFMFFRQYQEATTKFMAADQKAKEQEETARNVLTENNQLKEMIGLAATDKMDTATTEFNKDMETYGANYDQANRNYKKILAYLFDVVQKKNTALASEQDQVKKLTDSLASFEQNKQPQIDQHAEAAKKAGGDVLAMRQQFTTDLDAARGEKSDLLKQIETAQTTLKETQEKAAAAQQKAAIEISTTRQLYDNTRGQLEKAISPVFETADGEIRWVNQRQGTVWVNLGRADGLKRQTTFSVYSSAISDVTSQGRKASIEVTQILGDHLAEARIVEDSVSDPIMPGDVIHTPIWAPGQREQFALAGLIDIDGDDKSDLPTVRNLIVMNGGVVDAAQDGEEITGKMTTQTRYLIVGKEPAPDSPKAVMDAYQKMIDEARKIGIKEMSLQDLLRRMGWVDENQVIGYGTAATEADYRAKQPKDSVPRTSPGSVSGLFKPRNPPRATRGSAY